MSDFGQHDTTVAVVSSTVKVFNKLPPPYASLLLFELHEEGGQFCVKLRYRNDTTQPAHTLVHPGMQTVVRVFTVVSLFDVLYPFW